MTEDFFEDLGKTITKAATNVVDKTGELFESTKIKAQITGEDKLVDKSYRDIGEIIYKLHMEGQPFGDDVMRLCDDVQAHKDRINELKAELAEVKKMKLCPGCNEPVEKAATYCPKCGTAFSAEEPETETEADAEVVEEVVSEVEDQASDAVDDAKDAAKNVKEKAEDVIDQVKDTVEDIADKVEDKVEDIVEDVKDKF